MTRMWRGPCEATKAVDSDQRFVRVIRELGRQGIFFDLDSETGCKAAVFKLSTPGGRCGTYFRHEIGKVQGVSPFDTVIRVAHEYLTISPEMIELYTSFLLDKAENIVLDYQEAVKGLDFQLGALEAMLASVRP